MRDARKFDARISIGGVPDSEDLEQLRELGFKTVIDTRDDDEKYGGKVETRVKALGLTYVGIPVVRDRIEMEDVREFFEQVYRKGSAPLYCFSRYGKRPLAFLLLFEAVATKKPLAYIFQKANRFGINIEGDALLHEFLVNYYNEGRMNPLVADIRALRPDLLSGPVG
jgi:uncharacterized protein (TIGR01244 family)